MKQDELIKKALEHGVKLEDIPDCVARLKAAGQGGTENS